MTVDAVVRVWHDEQGWGVLDSPATPGGCWTHYSALDQEGYRSAVPGQRARLVYERAEQDGFRWRAVHVRLEGVAPAVSRREGSGAYGPSREITWDEPGEGG